jgi:pyruvate,orthophosphate dikinase
VILLRHHLSPDDLAGIEAARGILTATGGRTSHAAVVARELGRVCIVGCPGLRIASAGDRATLGGRGLREGDPLSLDGNTGSVYAGELPVRRQQPTELLERLAAWREATAATAGGH